MPEAVVPCCLLLLLLTLPLSAGSLPAGGVDLIARTPYSLDAGSTVPVRERLIALERRLVQQQQPCTRLLIVFVQLSDGRPPHLAGDTLSLAIDAFAPGHRTPRLVLRGDDEAAADALSSAATLADRDSYCVVLILLLPDLGNSLPGTLLQTTARLFPLALKLLLLGSAAPTDEELSAARTLLAALWQTERALRALTIWYRPATGLLIGAYDPFEPPAGRFYTLAGPNRTDLPTDLAAFGRRMNLRGSAITVYGFEAAMAYRRQDIDMLPRTFPARRPGSTHASRDALLDALFGADVEAVRELARRMNFTPVVHHMRANFGFKMANGTFTGVLGRLVARDAWLSMNVYFLKDYETRDLQFGAAVYQDSLCVFVQAAGMLPDWLLIFRCFTPTLWIGVWSTVAVVSLCYLALTLLIAIYRPAWEHGRQHTGNVSPDQPQQDLTGLVGQIVGALLTAPTNGFHRTTTHQKLFVAFGLIWGLTITGAFQGSLVDVYTTPTSMKNLDTLAELDASGLSITVTAPALIVDVFGTERPGSTLGNLKRRLVIETATNRSAAYGVLGGRTAGLIRNQDFVRLSTKYLGRDGTPRLHRMRQCPRSYTLAYLYPRGSPLYRAANDHTLHFLQHGLYAKWQREAAHIVRANRALKVQRYAGQAGRTAGQAVTLRLDHLLLPFMVLGAGFALGVVCFAWECRALLTAAVAVRN
ncbi:AGAP000293-PA [Anopheles gambiae str. PEST]|uniref:AGAP000293-PA n=1 Tax=Anopheles gambiae TaxID=7165 RepID=A7USI6_ANOGA|nr:AGAP000293-PA [Anopheles gambiae str. PEST]